MRKQKIGIKDEKEGKEKASDNKSNGNNGNRTSNFRKYMQDKIRENLPPEEMNNVGSFAERVGARIIQDGQRIRLSDQISLVKTHEIGVIDNVGVRTDMSRYTMEKVIGEKEDGTPLIREYRVYGNVPVNKLTDSNCKEYKDAYMEYILNELRLTKNSGYLGELEELVPSDQAKDVPLKDRYCIHMDNVQLDATKKMELKQRGRDRRAERKFLDEVVTNRGVQPTKVAYRPIENGQRIEISPEVTLIRVNEIGYAYNIQETSHMFEYCIERRVGTDEDGKSIIDKSSVYGNVPVNRLDDPKYKDAYLKYILDQRRLEQAGGYLGNLEERAESEREFRDVDADKYYISVDELEKGVAMKVRYSSDKVAEVQKREPKRAEVVPIDKLRNASRRGDKNEGR